MKFPIRDRHWEDKLLAALWAERGGAGWWLLELPVGYLTATGPSSRDRRVDAAVLPNSESRISEQLKDLDDAVDALEGQPVELIEAKGELNIDVIGQLLCGASMFSSKYPHHGQLRLTAVVAEASDAALRWYCDLERIQVVQVKPAESSLP